MIKLLIENLRLQWEKDRLILKRREIIAKIIMREYFPPYRIGVSHPFIHHHLCWIALYYFWYYHKKIRMWW
jgi:hypothetical protein